MTHQTFQSRIEIPIGSVFLSDGWPVSDDETGLGFDMTGWSARCEVKDTAGNVLTKFHSDRTGHASWPGGITLESVAEGANLRLFLNGPNTALLSPTDSAVFDVQLVDPTNTYAFRVVEGKCVITPGVTTDV